MLQFANKYANLVLAIVISLNFLVADGLDVITYPPRSIHQWRQSDCVAYAKTYYYRHSSFLAPATYNLAGRDGRVVSEFPIIYYLSAKLFLLFGFHYSIIRGLTFLCYFVGLFYLFGCVRFWIKRPLPALFSVVVLATAPFFYYYALNFLPNVPAISISFVGLYYLFRYQVSGHLKFLWIGTLLFIISALLKPTDGALVWFAWLGVVVVNIVFKKNALKFKVRLFPVYVSGVFILGSILGWYEFDIWYNNTYGNNYNLLGIYPIWDMSRREILHTLHMMVTTWLAAYQQLVILLLLVCFLIIYVIKWRKLNPLLRLFTLFLLLGAFVYDILWFKAFAEHDYYQLVNVVPPVFVFVTVFEYYEDKVIYQIQSTYRNVISIAFLLLIVSGIGHNRNIQHNRYTNSAYVNINPAIFEVEPYLRKIGIRPTDIVISIPDMSPNTSLAAMNNPGYTASFKNPVDITQLQKHGASYLIVNDSSYLGDPLYKPYLSILFGKYKNIYIYDIRPHDNK